MMNSIFQTLTSAGRFFAGLSLLVLLPGTSFALTGDAGYRGAVISYQSGAIATAQTQLEDIISRDEGHADALMLLGEIKLVTGDAASAEQVISEALMQGSDAPHAMVLLAEAYLKQGKLEKLITDLPMTGRSSPEAAEVMGYQALALLGRGQTERAAELLEKTARFAPQASMPRAAQSRLLLSSGQTDQALQLALDLSQEHPHSARAWSAVGEAAQANKDYPLALDAYGEALNLDAHLLQIRVTRARLLVYLGKDEESWQDLDFLQKYYPAEPRAAYLRGLVYERAGVSSVATDEFRHCALILSRLPSRWVAQSAQLTMEAASSHIRLGELEDARDYLQSFHARDDDNPRIARRLAILLIELGEPQQALDIISPMLAKYPADSRFLGLKARAYELFGGATQTPEAGMRIAVLDTSL